MMMSSNFLETSGDGDGAARFGRMPDDWMNGIDTTTMPFSGLDAPYEASTNPLQSPETPSLDNTVFPSPLTDLAYLDRSFGDFSNYAIHPTTPGQFPVHPPHRTSSTFSEGYDLSSASPSLGPVWPAHVSPAATFLPTPPMADELSAASSSPEEEDNQDDDDYDDDSSEPASKKRKRSTANKITKTKGKDAPKRNPTQLRTASRAPKKRGAAAAQPRHPSETSEEVKARAAHNQVEQQYRKRLNTHFERLLAVLPPPGTEGGIANDRRVSKAEVLDLARERIRALEKQTSRLERERRELRGRIAPDGRRVLV